jgi:hypothetical protein
MEEITVRANFKMIKILSILFLLLGLYSVGQVVKIDTLKVSPSKRFVEKQSFKLNYPIIRTGVQRIDSLINYDIKNKLTFNEYPSETIDSTIYKWAEGGLTDLNFHVTYDKNGIISLNISAETCGAYCTGWTEYFNYSIPTGKPLNLNSIVDTSGNFRNLVIIQRNAQYEKQKKELKEMLLDKKYELDSATYETALESYNECIRSFTRENFALYNDHLEIIETCDLPHFMQNLTPVIELKYKYNDIKEYLKIKN